MLALAAAAGKMPCGPAGSQDRRRSRRRPHPALWPETVPSSHRTGQAARQLPPAGRYVAPAWPCCGRMASAMPSSLARRQEGHRMARPARRLRAREPSQPLRGGNMRPKCSCLCLSPAFAGHGLKASSRNAGRRYRRCNWYRSRAKSRRYGSSLRNPPDWGICG